EAELVVGTSLLALPVEERYVSRVSLARPRAINVQLAPQSSQLFHFLSNSWRFEPGPPHLPAACWTSFAVAFKWRSQLHKVLTDLLFDQVYRRMLAAFDQRCHQLYGPPAPAPPFAPSASASPARPRPAAPTPPAAAAAT